MPKRGELGRGTLTLTQPITNQEEGQPGDAALRDSFQNLHQSHGERKE